MLFFYLGCKLLFAGSARSQMPGKVVSCQPSFRKRERSYKLLFSGGGTRPIPSPLGRGDRLRWVRLKPKTYCDHSFLPHPPSFGWSPFPRGEGQKCLTWRPPRAVILSKAAGRAEGSPSASPNHDHKRTFVYREILRLGRRPRSG